MSAPFDFIPTSDLSLQLAKKYVDAYDAMAQHRKVMQQCDECEALLESGIKAYHWLRHAEATIHAAAQEKLTVPDDLPAAINTLYRTWLNPCARAEREIQSMMELLGYQPSNLAEFRAACEYVKGRVIETDIYDSIDDAFKGKIFDSSFWADARELPSA